MRAPTRKLRIATRLVLAFLVMTLLPLAIVTFLSYKASVRGARSDATAALRAAADSKTNRLETFAQSRQEAALAWATQPSVVELFPRLEQALRTGGPNGPEYQKLDVEMRLSSRSLQDFGFTEVLLMSSAGEAVFAVNDREGLRSNYLTGPAKDSEAGKVFRAVQAGGAQRLFGFDNYSTNRLFGFVGVPIRGPASPIGVAVLEVNKEPIYNIVGDQTGLGKTGDTVVGSSQGDAVVLTAPSRLGADRTAGGIQEAPLRAALQGKSGDGASRDYRGVDVISAWRPVPTLGWGLEVKMDKAEIFAPLGPQRRTLTRQAVIGLPLVVLAALLAARSISRPIVRLTQVVRSISAGDLNRQVPVDTEDEVGELSVAFNAMTADLSRSYAKIEETVKELQVSRKRIVGAHDEARRRMERDIHDGAQQQLVSLSVKLGLVKTLMGKDLDRAAAMLDQVKVEANDTVESLRALARGLFPPLLAEKGLVMALNSHITKMAIPATIDAEAMTQERFTPDIEAGVYFCIREALQNASKYAAEAPITLTFVTGEGRLEFRVQDEGPGFDTTTAEAGMGTQTMVDRIEALGGELEILSAPGQGTTVVGRVPIETVAPAEVVSPHDQAAPVGGPPNAPG
jgi:signal transduction histidine kinase